MFVEERPDRHKKITLRSFGINVSGLESLDDFLPSHGGKDNASFRSCCETESIDTGFNSHRLLPLFSPIEHQGQTG